MTCPHGESTATHRRKQRTALGYRRFSCAGCQRRFNERTGTPFNELQFPTDIVLLAVLWRLRYKLGLRDVSERFRQNSGLEIQTASDQALPAPARRFEVRQFPVSHRAELGVER